MIVLRGIRLALRHWQVLAVVCITTASLSTPGCGGSDGPARYDLSGTVSFDGKPIPAGTIVFEPDTSAGNSGPQGASEIRDGKYSTAENGKGVVGGPHIVRIQGFDRFAENEETPVTPLFPEYQETADLPKESGTMDFDVPASAANAATGGRRMVDGP